MTSFLTPPSQISAGSAESPVTGNGFVINNKGHKVGRPLIAGGGIVINNPAGIDGPPTISTAVPGQIAFAKNVPCHIAGGTQLSVYKAVAGILHYRITHILFTNPTGTPVELRAGLYTKTGKAGAAILPASQAYPGWIDDPYYTQEIQITDQTLREKRSAPYLWFVPEIVNSAELYVDIHVRGEVLEWEINTPTS